MFHRILEFPPVVSPTGVLYRPRVYGELRSDATWNGWIVFFPIGTGTAISTPQETTQTSYQALSRWALALDDVYLEGALSRALRASPGVAVPPIPADLWETTAADAVALHRAAERAGVNAAVATARAEMHDRSATAARAQAARFTREQKDTEKLANETIRARAEATAAAHESAARAARVVAGDAGRLERGERRSAKTRRPKSRRRR